MADKRLLYFADPMCSWCYGFSPVRLGPELDFTSMYHGHDERIPVDGFRWGQRVLYELVREFVLAR